jgi:predicted peptidase
MISTGLTDNYRLNTHEIPEKKPKDNPIPQILNLAFNIFIMRTVVIFLFAFFFLHFSSGAQQLALKINLEGQEDSLSYLMYLPEDYGKPGQDWPLMIFLHGAGERGDDIALVKKNGPPMLLEQGKHFQFIVASPQCPAGKRWRVDVLSVFLESLLDFLQVDTSRIYLTGLSMGGQGTWNWAKAEPWRFAAIVPICGRADTTKAGNIKDLPTWVFHGAEDDVVPISDSKEIVEYLKKLGSPVKFTIYPEAGHDSWTETYANPELYEWLMQQ